MVSSRDELKNSTGMVRWPNVIWQGLHLGGGGGFLVVLWLVLARAWGAEQFGLFNYLFAFTAVSGIFADFGLDVLLTRHIAKDGCRIPSTLFPIKFAVTTFMLLSCFFVGMKLGLPMAALALMLAGVCLLSWTTFLNAFFRGIERLDLEAKIGFLQKMFFVGGSLCGVLFWDGHIVWVASSYLASHAMALIITAWFSFSVSQKLSPGKSLNIGQLIPEVWPLWTIALLTMLSVRLDILLLEWLSGKMAVGLYAASSRLMDGLIVMGTAYMAALFPRLVAIHNKKIVPRQILSRSVLLLVLAGGLVGMVGSYFSPWFMPRLYGQGFMESIKVFKYLVLALPMVFVVELLGQNLIAESRQRIYAYLLTGGVIVNILINIWLIPAWGAQGAVAGYWGRVVFLLLCMGWMGARFKVRGNSKP